MEQAFFRFPHLSENIFDLLDNKSLADCKEVSKAWYFYLDVQTFLQPRIIKANKIKYVEKAIDEIQIDFKQTWKHFAFTEEDVDSIMDNARNLKFEHAHKDLMKKILSCYIPDWQRYSGVLKEFKKDTETLEFKQDQCLFIATYRRHFSSRVSNIGSNNSQNVGLEIYKDILSESFQSLVLPL